MVNYRFTPAFIKISGITTLLILFSFCINCNEKTREVEKFTFEKATVVLKEYTAALERGDSTSVYEYWSKESRDKQGFWLMHVYKGELLAFHYWEEFLKKHTYEIEEVLNKKDFSNINLRWIPNEKSVEGNQNRPLEMKYYIIREDNGWKLINPIDALTRNWRTFESEYLIYHYPSYINIKDYHAELQYMDDTCRDVVEQFNIDFKRKVHFYKTNSPEENGELIFFPPAHGYANSEANFLVSINFVHPHELVHVLDRTAGINRGNNVFMEGLAVAFGGCVRTTPEYALIKTRNLMDSESYIPLRELLTNQSDFFRKNYYTYAESGALVKFIIDKFGMDTFRELCKIENFSPEMPEEIVRISGFKIADLEEEWKKYLQDLPFHEVGFSIPDEAECVFEVSDPAGDDNGDGDYKYPNDKFGAGVFDLRKFEVHKDNENAYFRITFRKLTEPVSYRSPGEKFIPGAVIAINKNENTGSHKQGYCHGVEFADDKGFDIKLNVGMNISVCNNFGQVFYTTPVLYNSMANKKESTLIFSFPVDFIGEPQDTWEYFVGVGLMSDYSMDFLHAGPIPVQRDFPVFIRGGNFDYGNPAFIDILLPEKINQRKLLNNYDPEKGKRAVVPMVDNAIHSAR